MHFLFAETGRAHTPFSLPRYSMQSLPMAQCALLQRSLPVSALSLSPGQPQPCSGSLTRYLLSTRGGHHRHFPEPQATTTTPPYLIYTYNKPIPAADLALEAPKWPHRASHPSCAKGQWQGTDSATQLKPFRAHRSQREVLG